MNDHPTWYTYHLRAYQDDALMARGGATVIAQQDAPDSDWRVSVAMCSPSDNYCRQAGTKIAAVRLASDRKGKTVHNVVRVQNGIAPRVAALEALRSIVSRYHDDAQVMKASLARERKFGQYVWFSKHVVQPLVEALAQRKDAAHGS